MVNTTNLPIIRWWAIFLFAWLMVGLAPPTLANEAGLNWLANQAQPDGSYSTPDDLATPFQATVETWRTFYQMGETPSTQPSMTTALGFINADSFPSTEHLARILMTRILAGQSLDIFINELATRLNSNGGFGDFVNYDSAVIDTAWLLEALIATPFIDTSLQNLYPAITYLLEQQHFNHEENGEWGWSYQNNQTSIYATAIVMRALWHYRHHLSNVENLNIIPALDNAQEYLLAQRDSNGLWAETIETALALIAIIPRLPNLDEIYVTIDALRTTQLANGSWDNDVYTTALALMALYLADNKPTNPDLGQIIGTVIDGQTDLPLADILIQLSGNAADTQLTNIVGKFDFSELAPGNYTIQIGNDNGTKLTAETTLLAGQTINLGKLRLFRTANMTAIQGNITDATTKQPLENVAIVVTSTAFNETVLTNSQGAYLFNNVASGEVTLQINHEGYLPISTPLTITIGATFIVSLALTPDSATLEGIVTDGETQLPLANTKIYINDTLITQTEVDGSYQILKLESGELNLRAEHSGYNNVETQVGIIANTTLTFSPQLYPSGTTPPIEDNAGIKGVVIGQVSQNPLADVTVTCGNQTIITDGSGQFSFTTLSPNDSQLELTLTGYQPKILTVNLEAFTIIDLGAVILTPNDYQEMAGIKGNVIDATTNQALLDVQITAIFGETSLNTTTQADGSFEIASLTDFAGELSLSLDNYAPLTLTISLAANEILDLGQIRLRPAEIVALLPDLVADPTDMTGVQVDLNTLRVAGVITVPMKNIGITSTSQPITLLAFYDTNLNNRFDANLDIFFGQTVTEELLEVEAITSVNLNVSGQLPFRDAPIQVWLDSEQTTIETDEENNFAVQASACSGSSTVNTIDLVLCLDSSGSVSYSQYRLQLEGTANAVEDPDVMPHDGSVRLSVLQFSSGTIVEVPPTFIDSNNASEIAETIRNIGKWNGGTAIHSCINKAVTEIQAAPSTTDFQVINVSTDGYSSRYHAQAASQAAQEAGIDVLNGIAVGGGADFVLLESIVFPQPPGGDRGYVIGFSNYEEYAAAISSYIQTDTQIDQTDFSTARLHLTKNYADNTLSLHVRVGNGGVADWPSNQSVVFWEGEPNAGGTLLGIVALDELTGSQYQDIQLDGITNLTGIGELYAVVDSDGHVAECNEDNNSVNIQLQNFVGNLDMSTDASEYGPYTPVLINYTVANQGILPLEQTLPSAFSVEFDIQDVNGDMVARLPVQTLDTLIAGESRVEQTNWNTGTWLVGSYQILPIP